MVQSVADGARDMHDYSQIISAGVGPIIVISACGLLCLAFYNRLTAVVTRLRGFDRERLTEQAALDRAAADGTDLVTVARHQEVLAMLRTQTHLVRLRAHLIRRTLVCFLVTIGCLALCSLAVGLSTIWKGMTYVAVPLFVVGLGLLVTGVLFALLELRYALRPVELEGRVIGDLTSGP